ncbi:type VI secretion system membrane subunit TssM [Enterobacillus tribolii]|uniref:Type VI secretion system protein ImpL n=1 Tax=Enterobacillus tribolii TaxID=1487935 RepID=A0A370QHB7_9GAMM|nr:type VI secretion system membrane subunit TssM [Enterobacillus tribolii]MBW7982464.1 type VI secretion system membrane subunit TssM [Enterobacillus tribolii]RDK87743.1 type VI secretion system protein ImpL [Enterobacillus tribolii]
MKVPGFFRVLKPALPRFKASALLLLVVAWCVAVFWVWWWGPEWEFGQQKPLATPLSRWLVTAVLVLIALGWLTLRILRRLQQLERLQKLSREEVKDPVSTDINHQRRYLTRWLLQLERHLNTRRYLYQLPWYLVIGSRASGKSTLLQEGQKLAPLFVPEKMKGEHSADLHVHCWAGEQAVMLDVDGLLIEQPLGQDADKPEVFGRLWRDLLKWLGEVRTRQPLNGVVLTVNIGEFMTLNKAQRDAWLATMRQRLQDLRLRLHCQLPVYVVLTHMDLFYGFDAMFQSLDKTQRESVLGVTFSQQPDVWRKELDAFWQGWIAKMNDAMPGMMINDVDGGQRSLLFSYVRQMYGLHEYVVQLLDGILFNDEHPPLLRGVYLTSARQSGQMDDLFVQSAAAQYHLGTQAFPTWPLGDSAPYFTHALFNSVLFSEPNLAGENTVWLEQSRRRLMCFSAVGGVALLCLFYGWHHYYQTNYRAGVEVLAQAKSFLEIPPPVETDNYGNLQLPLLNPIREATLAYGDYHERNALLADMGLYQGYKIGPYVEDTYLQLLQQRYLPALMNGLLKALNEAPAGSEEKLNILRVMRMLEDKSGRNKALIEQFMAERWSQRFSGQNSLQGQLMGHLEYALERTDWRTLRAQGNQEAISSFSPYAQPIRDAQRELSKLSIYQRVYQSLRAKSQQVLPSDLNLRDQIGANFDTVFTANNEKLLRIPQFLTSYGLKNYFVKQRDGLVELTAMDSWVLNLTQNVQYSEADRKEIQRHITEQYLSDYSATWRASMSNLEVLQFDDMQQVIAALEQVISGDQVFRRALQTLRDNTQAPALPEGIPDKARQEFLDTQDYRLFARISRDFAPENSVLMEQKDGSGVLQGVYQKLTDLHRYLLAIQNSPTPGKSALKAVQMRLSENSSDPIFAVQQMAKNLPDPLNRWVGELAEQAWRVVMIEAIQYLEIEWGNSVVKPWQTYLSGRYPFTPNARDDAPLSEFERFFKPGGTLDAFYQQNLKPFIENELTWGSDGQVLIRSDIRQQLEAAQKIRETFFTPQNGLGTQYAIETVELSSGKRRSVLNMDGQLLEYTHGRARTVHLVWPNSMRAGVESKLTLVPDISDKAPRSIGFIGPWAQLRLINSGQLTSVSEGSFNVRFNVDGGYMIYRVHVDASDNPFAGGLFSRFNLPETLY